MARVYADWPDHVHDQLESVRRTSPLVQCLTNSVTTNLVANALLAVGASPAMVDVPGEAGPFAQAASGILMNLGTGSSEQWQAMREAAHAARRAQTPFVIDPVAAGALPLRTQLAHDLIELGPAVIRGNASEIRAIQGVGQGGRGVDSTQGAESALEAAVDLARRTGVVVAVSGDVDVITDGDVVARVSNGNPMLTRITGAGCALGGVIAAFAGSCDDMFAATVAACAVWTIAAEIAAGRSNGPGTMAPALLDALYGLDRTQVTSLGRIA